MFSFQIQGTCYSSPIKWSEDMGERVSIFAFIITAKGILRDFFIKRIGPKEPVYETTTGGPPHNRTHTVKVVVPSQLPLSQLLMPQAPVEVVASGTASKKRDAEKLAAVDALRQLLKLNLIW